MNAFFSALNQLNDLQEVKEKDLFFGVTTFGSKKMEFWYSTRKESQYVGMYLQSVIEKIGMGFSVVRYDDYEFYFRNQKKDY